MPEREVVRDPVQDRETPWRDPEILEELWYSDLTTMEICDRLGCAENTLNRWRKRFDLEPREQKGGEWTDKELMFEMYWGDMMSSQEIADELGCQQTTVSRWLHRHDIPVRHGPKKYGTVTTTWDGYSYFCVDSEMVWVHRLVAIAEYGFDEVVDKQVHHKNGVPWDNRPENLEPLSDEEHINEHRDELLEGMG